MKVSKLLGERFKNAPSDCLIDSHKLMVRGGYMKYMANGIYSLFMPTKRITRKIENIIREEMDKIDGQEVMFPVVMPATLWRKSGRYESIGSEMARFTDRNNNDMVLGMTHEEAAVHLAKDTAQSYANYPFMIYQIQTKFRDEPRSRGGLIRVREFTMKDAYSFHTSQEDLEAYYEKCFKAYERIFRRAGAKNVIPVKSDSGMMGGSVSHEFMLLADIGEDTLAICSECDFKANMEAAPCIVENNTVEIEPLEKIYTPDIKTIEDLKNFLDCDKKQFGKAVVYQKNSDDKYIVVFIRGDLEVNETKLRNYIGEDIHPAQDIVTEECGIVPGFIGPVGLTEKAIVVYDKSLEGINAMVCGANELNYHYKGINLKRDVGEVTYTDVAKTYEGAVCPVCGKHTVTIKKGIEVGNIFQLGTKYTKAMEMTYLDNKGQAQYPIMGCYGIGVGRLAASVCEAKHDDNGPIWPMSIAPWQVHICAIRPDNEEVAKAANGLYDTLQEMGIEVIFDDRKVSAGVMFADADLLGVPVRVVISPKTIGRGVVEVSFRDKSFKGDINLENAADEIKKIVKEQLAKFDI